MADILVILWSYSNRLTPHQARMNDLLRYAATNDDAWNFDVLSVQFEIDTSQECLRSVPDPEHLGKLRYIQSVIDSFRTFKNYDIIHLTYLDVYVLPYIIPGQKKPMVIGPNVGKYRNPECFDQQSRKRIFELEGNSEYKSKIGNALMKSYLSVSKARPGPKSYLGFSSWDVQTALVDRGIPNIKTRVLPLGVPTDVFNLGERSPELSYNVLFVGTPNSHRLKGFDLFVSAMEEVLPLHPDLTVTVAGMESFPMSDRQLSDRIQNRFDFVGWLDREDLAEYFRKADLYVHPSYSEAGSTTFAEALACGTPVVATDDYSFSESKKGKNTLLFERGNEAELRESIIRFYGSPRQYITAAREHALDYSIADTYDALLDIYQSLLR